MKTPKPLMIQFLISLLLIIALLVTACQDSDSDSDSNSSSSDEQTDSGVGSLEDQRAVLNSLGNHVIFPTLTRLSEASQQLSSDVQSFCSSLGSDNESSNKTSAQDQWKTLMSLWQQAELFQLGPVAENESEQRNLIYSWPIVSACAVDQDVMLHRQDSDGYDITRRLVNRRGLDALEYLLFTDSLDHQCPLQSAPEGWDALSDEDKQQARCDYANVVVADLEFQINQLFEAWSPDHQNYLQAFVHSGQEGGAFGSAAEAFNQVTNALFYLDKTVKDQKLAQVLGLTSNSCGVSDQACADDVEQPFSEASKDSLINNIKGFQALLQGNFADETEQTGFDDLITTEGFGEQVNNAQASIQELLNLLDDQTGSLKNLLETDYENALKIHTLLRTITDFLKTDFVGVLMLQIPERASGDAD